MKNLRCVLAQEGLVTASLHPQAQYLKDDIEKAVREALRFYGYAPNVPSVNEAIESRETQKALENLVLALEGNLDLGYNKSPDRLHS